MSYPINYPTPQNANVQIFYAPTTTGEPHQTWVKPQGASFVWFTLIGNGGSGDTVSGGGSGAVTNFMCPAFLIPDSLSIAVGSALTRDTFIYYQYGTQILTANGSFNAGNGTAMTANYFTAMGFFQSVAGQNGSTTQAGASTTTFLAGGNGNGYDSLSNYGYRAGGGGLTFQGFFQISPIIVGVAGSGMGNGGIGCGGGANGQGGDGLVVIITW